MMIKRHFTKRGIIDIADRNNAQSTGQDEAFNHKPQQIELH